MIWLNIIWPVFAMVALIFGVWFVLLFQRLGHMRRTPPTADAFATRDDMRRYFSSVELANDNLANLFELPVLFFAAVLMLIVTHATTPAQVTLAWLYVLLRAIHSIVHIGVRRVRVRAPIYWASTAVLMAMWVGFFIDMAREAARFHEAMALLAQP